MNKPGAGFGVVIVDDNKVLLGKRHEDPDKADSAFKSHHEWTLPGGKLEFRESFEEGATREVKEETDLDIKDPKVVSVHNCVNEHAHFVTIGLETKEFSGEVKVMEPDEITEWQWFSFDELPENLYFPSRYVLENYRKGEFYVKNQN